MTLAVVTRYFGGVKLGANGLVGAYSSSVSAALDTAEKADMIWAVSLKATVAYTISKKVEEIIKSQGGQIENISYDNEVEISAIAPCQIADGLVAKIVDVTQGRAKVEVFDEAYRKFLESKR